MRYLEKNTNQMEEDLTNGDISMDTVIDSRLSDNITEDSSMVSNLPLLFASGYPTSLEKITLAQLERFVMFMVRCSLGHDTTETIQQPQWWPKEVAFSNPLRRPRKITDSWMANLKKLVFRCYTYHRSEYLLRFCSFLARYPHKELEYVDNWDSTTSLFHKSTGKLLVTFRNENLNYDKKNENARLKLLLTNKSKQQSVLMVESPSDEIYLCDNCDAEFVGFQKMKEHERICYKQDNVDKNSRSNTPDVVTDSITLGAEQFLNYFQLSKKNACNNSFKESPCNKSGDKEVTKAHVGRIRGSISYSRFTAIPFSSPAGILLTKKSKQITVETQLERLERVERHNHAPALNHSNRPKWLDYEVGYDRWVVTYKAQNYSNHFLHEYSIRRSSKNKPILSIESQLLLTICRPLYVKMINLTFKQIEELKQNLVRKQHEASMSMSMKKPGPATSKLKCQQSFTKKRKISSDSLPKLLDTSFAADKKSVNTSDNKPNSIKRYKTAEQKQITLINLCSSDEEDDAPATSDENKDPMELGCNLVHNILKRSKRKSLCAKARIYSTTESSIEPKDNISNNEMDKHLKDMIINTGFSPILGSKS